MTVTFGAPVVAVSGEDDDAFTMRVAGTVRALAGLKGIALAPQVSRDPKVPLTATDQVRIASRTRARAETNPAGRLASLESSRNAVDERYTASRYD